MPLSPALPPTVPTVVLPANNVGIVDARVRFREILCSLALAREVRYLDRPACESALGEAEDKDGARRATPARSLDPRDTLLVFLPGLFGECFDDLAKPFGDSYAELQAMGFGVKYVRLSGRSSSALNAETINAELSRLTPLPGSIIVFGYSKGVADFLESAGRYPDAEWLARTRAFVAVAGVVAGSPLAEHWAGPYKALFASLDLDRCAPGDGLAIDSLTTASRLRWLSGHRLPDRIKSYSIAAVPTTAPINPLLQPFQSELLGWHEHNDGQVPPQFALLPRSYFLGYANADHWSVALPFNAASGHLAAVLAQGNTYPRDLLLRSVLSFIAETAAD